MAMRWPTDELKKWREAIALVMSSTESPRAPYIMKQKPNKNGKSNGQHATIRLQRNYFLSVRDRLGIKIKWTPKLAAVLTGNGKTRAYYRPFNLRDDAMWICGQGDHIMDHLLFHYTKTNTQREVLKQHTSQQGYWLASKQELISKYRNTFSAFRESIDFEHLQQSV